MKADVYVLLRARLPEGADAQTMTGAVSGVLAQHGALGRHETMHGDVEVQLVSAMGLEVAVGVPCITLMAFEPHPHSPLMDRVMGVLYRIARMSDDSSLQSAPNMCQDLLEAIQAALAAQLPGMKALYAEVARAQAEG